MRALRPAVDARLAAWALVVAFGACDGASTLPSIPHAPPPSSTATARDGGSDGESGSGGGADHAGSGGAGGHVWGAGGLGGDPTCGGVFVQPAGSITACEACSATQCCDEAMACASDPKCAPCLDPSSGVTCAVTGPTPNAVFAALENCLAAAGALPGATSGACADACAGGGPCNVVTNAGCPKGKACDVDATGKARCFDGTNDRGLCAPCDAPSGVTCAPTLHCLAAGVCGRFCCSDADCGSTGTCAAGVVLGASICVSAGLPKGKPACDAPAVAPSGGTCASP